MVLNNVFGDLAQPLQLQNNRLASQLRLRRFWNYQNPKHLKFPRILLALWCVWRSEGYETTMDSSLQILHGWS